MTSGERLDSEASPAVRTRRREVIPALALGCMLAYGALDQGGFYPLQFVTVLLLVAVALVATLLVRPLRPAGPIIVCATAWLAFAGWALLRAGASHDLGAGLSIAALAGCLVAATWSAHLLGTAGRRLLAVVVVAVGVVVAITGWVGLAWHLTPLALPSAGLWRAASTVTYANATAALLVTAVLVALATLPESRGLLSTLVLAVLTLGLVATMSRAGLLTLAGGLTIAATEPTLRRRLARAWPVLPAVAAGFAGLLPSLADGSAARPFLALAGVGAAGGVVVLAGRRPRTTVAAIIGIAALALLVAPPATLAGIGSSRLNADSAERADLARVTWIQWESAPVIGVGPGRLDLTHVDESGVPVAARFTHQEYLQVAGETGVVGLALVLVGIGALAAFAGTRRRRGPGPTAALAALAAFAVHSGFDFLWHVPVLPLLVAITVAALVPGNAVPRA